MSLTLTHYEVVASNGSVIARCATQDYAVNFATWVRDSESVPRGPVLHTYNVGDKVEVDAFGRYRPGTVVKLGRTKVTVEYQRNQQGTLATRAFGATEVRPQQP